MQAAGRGVGIREESQHRNVANTRARERCWVRQSRCVLCVCGAICGTKNANVENTGTESVYRCFKDNATPPPAESCRRARCTLQHFAVLVGSKMRESKAGMKKEGGGAARLGIGTFSRGPPRRHMAIEEVCTASSMSSHRHVALVDRQRSRECQVCHIGSTLPALRELMFSTQHTAIEERQQV